jgi:MOSC domain-containing protein YiiM
MMGELKTIWIKRFKGGPMDETVSVSAVEGKGLEGNADQHPRRQVTVISAESWSDAEREVDGVADPVLRRANLLVSGVDLAESRGKILRVGPVRVRIHGETRPCRRMEESCAGLQAALSSDWRAGAYGDVVEGGEIRLGDTVELEDLP